MPTLLPIQEDPNPTIQLPSVTELLTSPIANNENENTLHPHTPPVAEQSPPFSPRASPLQSAGNQTSLSNV
jgi:hypothetical protein